MEVKIMIDKERKIDTVAVYELAAKDAPLELMLEADPSLEQIRTYLSEALLYQAEADGETVGIAALVELPGQALELVNIAVVEAHRGKRIGRRLIEHILAAAKERNYKKVIVKTGASGIGQLSFYQKLGFRMVRINPDHFVRSYPDPIIEYDMVLRDQVELEYRLFTFEQCRLAAAAYWETFVAENPEYAGRTHTAWSFGYGEYVPNYLLALVKNGTKTGTSSAFDLYELEGEEVPRAGDLSVVTYGNGMPGCIIETTEVRIQPFDQIGEREAALEGEGDLSLAYWREVHEHFFQREYSEMGLPFSWNIPVVFEQFKVVYNRDIVLPEQDGL
jgi:uncharacterized protein YhfF/ribosomal protein S18 acetylase RimI-like enzyme